MRITKEDLEESGFDYDPELIELFSELCPKSEAELKEVLINNMAKDIDIYQKYQDYYNLVFAYQIKLNKNKAPSEEFKQIISEKYGENFDVMDEKEEIEVVDEFCMYLTESLSKNDRVAFFEFHLEECYVYVDEPFDEDEVELYAELLGLNFSEAKKIAKKLPEKLNRKREEWRRKT